MKTPAVFGFIGGIFLLTAVSLQADSTAEIAALKAKRDEARGVATKPVEVKYEQTLVALKTNLTKAGDIEGALLVDAELKALAAKALGLMDDTGGGVAVKLGDFNGRWSSVGGARGGYGANERGTVGLTIDE